MRSGQVLRQGGGDARRSELGRRSGSPWNKSQCWHARGGATRTQGREWDPQVVGFILRGAMRRMNRDTWQEINLGSCAVNGGDRLFAGS